jgi:acetyl-CoA carboxylase, biotin carboxylase subunit
MGDKITAKETAKELGIPVVPGSDGGVPISRRRRTAAEEIGYPVIIKATAGGGGRGMKVAKNAPSWKSPSAPRGPRRRTPSATTKSISRNTSSAPPHRDPGLRRRQGRCGASGRTRLFAAAPPPEGLRRSPRPGDHPEMRAEIGMICANAMKLGYIGAGTIEFLYEDGKFYFIEMNTRLQVEHPVTEGIFGVDLVREQIRVAGRAADVLHAGRAGDQRPLHRGADQRREDPQLLALPRPDHPVPRARRPWRPDGQRDLRRLPIPPYYDSLIGKLIVHGRDRPEALARLKRALSELIIDGIDTSIPLFHMLLAEPDIQNGEYNIHWLEKWLEKQFAEVKGRPA